ncbi:MAG: Minf_1886 family protein [Gemmatimonadota bacterium]
MSDVGFESMTLGRVLQSDPRYPEKAYVFVLLALQRVIGALETPRHVTARELALGCRDLALELYGPLARTVLEHWGIPGTWAIGDLVFNLLDAGVLSKSEEDAREDFHDVFDFDQAFGRGDPRGSRA